jgi:PHP family Zn ribbon phosphoesterase
MKKIVKTANSKILVYGTYSKSGHGYCPTCSEFYNSNEKSAAETFGLDCENCGKTDITPVELGSIDHMPDEIEIV